MAKMQEANVIGDFEVQLDAMGQQPLLGIYTQLCFCFGLKDTSPVSVTVIIDILTTGLRRLTANLPWLAGQVADKGTIEDSSGRFRIKPWEKLPKFTFKDLRNNAEKPPLTMEALRQATFPFSMLDENIIAPGKTLPASHDASEPAPVFLVQATLITGGLLLTFNGQHQVMDMTGQGHLIHLLAKACRHEQFTDEEISTGNLARHNIIPLLSDEEYRQQESELARHIVKPTPTPSPTEDTVICTWAYFVFPQTSLVALKTTATETAHTSYVSTDDALSAFIWQSVIRVRLRRLEPTVQTTFARAVDVRPILGVSKMYPGLLQNMTFNTETLQTLVEKPLGYVASELRRSLDPEPLLRRTRALATFFERPSNKTVMSFTGSLDLSVDMMLSSWAKLDCRTFDFGFGKPEAVRRPRFDTVESLVYLLPRASNGEIAVGMCLRDEDLERLKADESFAKYAKYIG